MGKKYRVGVIGYAHSHILYHVDSFLKQGDRIEWVASADNHPLVRPINDSAGTRYGIMNDILGRVPFQKTYDDYRKMLDENRLDIVLMCADNALHGEVAEAVLRKGAHVVLEKPFAASMPEAMRMVRAAEEGGAQIVTNWPTTWSPAIRRAHQLIGEGEIGRLFKVTFRNADSLGPLSYGQRMTDVEKGYEWWYQLAAGGGALLDYCCYGACLSRWFFGEMAVSAYGLKGNFDSRYGDAEDYATITARYRGGVAIVEGSWTTVNTGVSSGPVFYGTKGTMVVEKDGSLAGYKTRHQAEPDVVYDVPPLPAGRTDIAGELLHHLETGEALHPTLSLPVNLDAMALLDAGIRSATSGKMELLNDRAWCIG
ncbi:MAG: Gfo/Idh/MocA family oxidoreductase [Clostridiales bacterium]|nr:Gfo/Idh/MocA family oxidoreductase [Clostridiales bacterium]